LFFTFFYYAMVFVAFLVGVVFYSMSWHSLLQNLNLKAKARKVLLFAWTGMFFDAAFSDPGWFGDLSKAYMLSKASGQDPGRIVTSGVGQKIIVMAVTVVDLSRLGALSAELQSPERGPRL
jgi:uncharacterized membrane protein YbhN (UPF0104 family)